MGKISLATPVRNSCMVFGDEKREKDQNKTLIKLLRATP